MTACPLCASDPRACAVASLCAARAAVLAAVVAAIPGAVRVVWLVESVIGDVLVRDVDGWRSALPETMARLAALPGVRVATWDPSPDLAVDYDDVDHAAVRLYARQIAGILNVAWCRICR